MVARSLARQFVGEVEAACAPHQFALSTRAGTDSLAHTVRLLTEFDPNLTLLSIDGIGAFDNVRRQAMLQKLLELLKARSMLPFLRFTYARSSKYEWQDDEGFTHNVFQAEGGEQGDPLMPLLFSLGIADALTKV